MALYFSRIIFENTANKTWNFFFFPGYRKIPIISPGLIIVQKAFLVAYFWGGLFPGELILGGFFCFKMSWV